MRMNCQKFIQHYKENPQVYKAFARFTFEAIKSGRKHFGAEFIINRIRWFTMIESKNELYKVSNNYKAYYVRLFELRNPSHKGFFRKKKSVSDRLRYNKTTGEVYEKLL